MNGNPRVYSLHDILYLLLLLLKWMVGRFSTLTVLLITSEYIFVHSQNSAASLQHTLSFAGCCLCRDGQQVSDLEIKQTFDSTEKIGECPDIGSGAGKPASKYN